MDQLGEVGSAPIPAAYHARIGVTRELIVAAPTGEWERVLASLTDVTIRLFESNDDFIRNTISIGLEGPGARSAVVKLMGFIN